ncbi:MAG TPA: outer membrane beta-barrel protein [Xanthobacteraceae bacterium]|jgi:opacity protein-like surface antigen|nr:outer membrane beta-barrel protein [Xanthobacteraceae bacterium]
MAYLRNLAFAGAVALAISPTASMAADMPLAPLPAPVEYGGWYLRGDIGITNQSVKRLDSPAFTPDVAVLQKSFDSAGLFGVGAGYQFNSWLRSDVTGEYRSKANFSGLDFVSTIPQTNQYRGDKSEWLFLWNVYADLGTWYNITPFVGAGIGFTQLTIGNFTDVSSAPALGISGDHSKWNFAWALHAGLAYHVTPNFTVELAYRYVNLGNGSTNDMTLPDGSNPTYNPIQFKNVYSNDIKLGVRWAFASGGYAPYEEPLVRKY